MRRRIEGIVERVRLVAPFLTLDADPYPVVHEGRMPGWVGLEYMAQTISAWSGAQHAQQGGSPRLGMLLGTRRYHAHVPDFAAGTRLRIEVHQEFVGANGLGMFDCRILREGEEVATARLSIFEPEDGESILRGSTP